MELGEYRNSLELLFDYVQRFLDGFVDVGNGLLQPFEPWLVETLTNIKELIPDWMVGVHQTIDIFLARAEMPIIFVVMGSVLLTILLIKLIGLLVKAFTLG